MCSQTGTELGPGLMLAGHCEWSLGQPAEAAVAVLMRSRRATPLLQSWGEGVLLTPLQRGPRPPQPELSWGP